MTRVASRLIALDPENASPYEDASEVVIPKGTTVSHMIKWGQLTLIRDAQLTELLDANLDVQDLFGLEPPPK